MLCSQSKWYRRCVVVLNSGTDVAVSDSAGITVYSLVNGAEKRLKGIKVFSQLVKLLNVECSKFELLTRFQGLVLFNSKIKRLCHRSIQRRG